ncbi:heme A synthase [Ramlibacter sp. WS9]|uniref:COX15/CtaA family protein n=1 Tax=Ramlibacter sp. WS9 TaxID=1882741 RepID=UPI0035198D8C
MNPQPLYDLSPALRLMFMGVVVALGPLAWVWLRNAQAAPARRLQALTVLTLFLTFDLVVFGAFTRLTDSGLGCPDWPGCYGNASPSGAQAEISRAQAEMPTGPVTHGKAWIEMVHRYLATGVGVLILTLAAATWLQRKRGAPVNPWWPTVTLAWVCLQGAFGALTVTMKLFPAIVTLHLLGGMVLLALLCRQTVVYEHVQRGKGPSAISPRAIALLFAAVALLWLQIALGGWVSTNYAVLACREFPTCQGSWWPAMDWRHGFELWRELGKTAAGRHLDFAALTAIHYAHRLLAYLVLAVLLVTAWQLHAGGALRRQARWIAGLALWQLASGLSNVVLGWPIVAALAHTGGAAALVVVLTWSLCESRVGSMRASPHPHLHPGKQASRGPRDPLPEGEGVTQ